MKAALRFVVLGVFVSLTVGIATAQQPGTPPATPFFVRSFPQYLAGAWRTLDQGDVTLTRVYTLHSDGSLSAEVQYCGSFYAWSWVRGNCVHSHYMSEQYTFDPSSSCWSISSAPDTINRPPWPAPFWHPIGTSFHGTTQRWQAGNTWVFYGSSKRVKYGDVVERRVVYIALSPDVVLIDWQTLVNGKWQHDAKTFGRLDYGSLTEHARASS